MHSAATSLLHPGPFALAPGTDRVLPRSRDPGTSWPRRSPADMGWLGAGPACS